MGTMIKGFDARLANRPSVVFDCWQPECRKVKNKKMVG